VMEEVTSTMSDNSSPCVLAAPLPCRMAVFRHCELHARLPEAKLLDLCLLPAPESGQNKDVSGRVGPKSRAIVRA
jgi:hypothetical protein